MTAGEGPDDAVSTIEFVPLPERGRTFTATRRVRWGDVDPVGTLRLDALARYLQDVANDDTRDAGLDPTEPWVVRRTAVRIDRPLRNGELVDATTWSGGHGRRWAERRTSLVGSDGGRIEAAALWVRIDAASGRPAKLDARFHEIYDEAAGGRTVASKLLLSPPREGDGVERRPFPLRASDLDALGHVNNAIAWNPVVDALAERTDAPGGVRLAVLEHPGSIEAGDRVEVLTDDEPGGFGLWAVVDGEVRVAARIRYAGT